MWNAVVIVSRSQTAFFFCMELGKFPNPIQKKKSGLATRDYCGYATELFTHSAFQSLEKKAFQRRIKGLPWHSTKTVFGRTVS